MAHKVKVNGTNYEVSGGRAKINGTAYSIDKGKTLVGGTAYEVGFAKPVKITVKADNESAECWVEHNGVRYKYPSTSFVANVGDTILCHCYGEGMESGEAVITVNGYGNTVATAPFMGSSGHADEMEAEYEYTVVSDAVIHLEHNENTGYMSGYIEDNVHITEIPQGHMVVNIVGTGSSTRAYVTIEGIKYTKVATVAVPIGTTIYCYAGGGTSNNKIYLNGGMASYNSKGAAEYHHTVVSDVMILLECNSTYYSDIYITEIPEGQIAFSVNSEIYFAEEGMTWGEFVDSEYNGDGSSGNYAVFALSWDGTMIQHIEESLTVYDPNAGTYELMYFGPNTLIKANYVYRLGKD